MPVTDVGISETRNIEHVLLDANAVLAKDASDQFL